MEEKLKEEKPGFYVFSCQSKPIKLYKGETANPPYKYFENYDDAVEHIKNRRVNVR